jgi:hypothetical protein
LDGTNSISVTYEASWEDCDGGVDWFWEQFVALTIQDGLVSLPIAARPDHSWLLVLRKENNSIRVVLNEKNPDGTPAITPETPGSPSYLFYGPKAEIKMRCQNLDVVNYYLERIYAHPCTLTEVLQTTEWALVAALNGGEIPIKHRVIRNPEVPVSAPVWNSRIYEAVLHTQNYDKGIERFVGKFDPEIPDQAVISIEKGAHFDHGTAIYFTQDKRRCLLLDTLYGFTDDEALWYRLSSWARFQPRLAKPRKDPSHLCFPAVYLHVFEKYWDYLNAPLTHPDCSESDFTKAAMNEFTSALSQMNLSSF